MPTLTVLYTRPENDAEGFQEAMGSEALGEASKHAMGMVQKYGNNAEMLIGGEVA